jgi:hypothetical protein
MKRNAADGLFTKSSYLVSNLLQVPNFIKLGFC